MPKIKDETRKIVERFPGARVITHRHPAQFREDHLEWFAIHCPLATTVLDPFAGVGNVHRLREMGYETAGVEIEENWAYAHPDTIVGDATDLPFPDESFDAVFTSPVFGNRMSDHHNAQDASRRNTYTHAYGEPLMPNNSGKMHFHQPAYKKLHYAAWKECHRVLREGGDMVVNVKNFVRKGEEVDVVGWHAKVLANIFGNEVGVHRMTSPGLREGANSARRVDWEAMLKVVKT